MFIELSKFTDSNATTLFFVRPEHISTMEYDGFKTTVYFYNGTSINVLESPREIVIMIGKGEEK